MPLASPISASPRLRRWSALLLLALALVTGVSLSMTRLSGARLAEIDELVLPSLRLVHEMTWVVEEARGLSALHLLRADPAEQRHLEGRLQAAQQRIERRMVVSRQRLADDIERRHFQRVRASLTAYWVAQDRLLAASRQAVDRPPAAAQARTLLGGDSQAAFQQLRADLDAWWAYTDELAGVARVQGASQARQQQLLLVVQTLLVLGLGACWWAARPTRRAGARTPVAPSSVPPTVPTGPTVPAELPAVSLEPLAIQARLLALNAAVAAARGGALGPSATPAEGDLGRLAVPLGAAATHLSALAARAKSDTGPG